MKEIYNNIEGSCLSVSNNNNLIYKMQVNFGIEVNDLNSNVGDNNI